MTLYEPASTSFALLVGRVALATVFLVSGVHKAFWYQKAVEEFRDARVPLIQVLLPATIALHIVAPICLFLGIFVTESALLLAVFTVIVTVKVQHFWRMSGAERLVISRVALANLGVAGGLLILAVAGPGAFAIGSGG